MLSKWLKHMQIKMATTCLFHKESDIIFNICRFCAGNTGYKRDKTKSRPINNKEDYSRVFSIPECAKELKRICRGCYTAYNNEKSIGFRLQSEGKIKYGWGFIDDLGVGCKLCEAAKQGAKGGHRLGKMEIRLVYAESRESGGDMDAASTLLLMAVGGDQNGGAGDVSGGAGDVSGGGGNEPSGFGHEEVVGGSSGEDKGEKEDESEFKYGIPLVGEIIKERLMVDGFIDTMEHEEILDFRPKGTMLDECLGMEKEDDLTDDMEKLFGLIAKLKLAASTNGAIKFWTGGKVSTLHFFNYLHIFNSITNIVKFFQYLNSPIKD